MPYRMAKNSKGEYCIFNKVTGENKGCSSTRRMATSHMRALYANETGKKQKSLVVNNLVKKSIEAFEKEYPEECQTCDEEELRQFKQENENSSENSMLELSGKLDEMENKMYSESEYPGELEVPSYVLATSYAELEAYEEESERAMEINECIAQFPRLAANIMASSTIDDKIGAIRNLGEELTRKIGEYSRNYVGQYDDEDKEISSADKPEEELPKEQSHADKKFFARVKEAIKILFPNLVKENADNERDESFLIWKGDDGQYRWVARYSNNMRDRDNPPEIIASASHLRFVELVDKGLAPYPELWLWHVKEWKIGHATWVGYDNSGFALAAGVIDRGKEQVAEWLTSVSKEWGVSHGMPPSSIKRDEAEPTIILEHETREISPLPLLAAANLRTGFIIFKEDTMAIPQSKKDSLIKMGLPDEIIAKLEAINAEEAKKAAEEGVDSKELPPQVEALNKEPLPNEETPKMSDVSHEGGELGVPEKSTPTVDEIADAIASVVKPIMLEVEGLKVTIAEMNKELTNTREENATLKGMIEKTPQASLASMLMSRVIGDNSAKIRVDDPLANSKPKEAPKENNQRTGIPFIDQMLNDK